MPAQPGINPPHTYSNKKPKNQDPKLPLLPTKKVLRKKKSPTQPPSPPLQPSMKQSTPIMSPNRYTVLPVHEPHETILPPPPPSCCTQPNTQTQSTPDALRSLPYSTRDRINHFSRTFPNPRRTLYRTTRTKNSYNPLRNELAISNRVTTRASAYSRQKEN